MQLLSCYSIPSGKIYCKPVFYTAFKNHFQTLCFKILALYLNSILLKNIVWQKK